MASSARRPCPAPNVEQIFYFASPADYLVGISWCCGATPSDYTLQVGAIPPAPKPPPDGLVSEDLFLPGDGLLSLDTTTGLEWLDLTQTAGLSYDGIEAGHDSWTSIGFRHATGAEVCAFLGRHAAAPPGCPGPFALNLSADVATPFQTTVRATRRSYSRIVSSGLYNDGSAGSAGRATLEFASGNTIVTVFNDRFDSDQGDPFVGHFLVRDAAPVDQKIFGDGFEDKQEQSGIAEYLQQ